MGNFITVTANTGKKKKFKPFETAGNTLLESGECKY